MPPSLPMPPVIFATTELGFLLTLVAAFAAAFIGGAVATRLGQSPIIGYLVAGVVIGPFTPGFVADTATTQRVADVGVILLLFGVGLHFSLGTLVRLRAVAGAGGLTQIALTVAAGMLVGALLGWPPLASLFLGSATAISSSAVLAKVLDERGEANSEHGAIALGWMIVQDLVTIVLVVLLAGLSDTGGGSLGASIAAALAKAALFVAALLVIGLTGLPWALGRIARLRSRELFLVAIAVVALGTAYLAEEVGISLALGAFLAGLALSESDFAHHISDEIGPTRDLFAVLFFVSVGMLVDPRVIAGALPAFLLILAVIVAVKGALGAGFVRLLRYPRRTALFVGAGIAQAGEFSFLLARIGRDAGALSADRFTVILGACTASIVVAPLLYRLAERLCTPHPATPPPRSPIACGD